MKYNAALKPGWTHQMSHSTCFFMLLLIICEQQDLVHFHTSYTLVLFLHWAFFFFVSAAARRWHGSYVLSSQTRDQGRHAINSLAMLFKCVWESVNKRRHACRREQNPEKPGLALHNTNADKATWQFIAADDSNENRRGISWFERRFKEQSCKCITFPSPRWYSSLSGSRRKPFIFSRFLSKGQDSVLFFFLGK